MSEVTGESKELYFINKSNGELEQDASSEQSTDANFPADIRRSLQPLIFSMKLFGAYFKQRVQTAKSEENAQQSSQSELKKSTTPSEDAPKTNTDRSINLGRVYSTIVLVILWINVLRCGTAFTSEDKVGVSLTYKVVSGARDCLGAIMFTAYHVACLSSRLDRILREIRLTDQQAAFLRRLVIVVTVIAWLTIVIVVIVIEVYVFYVAKNLSTAAMAPFGTLIPIISPVVRFVIKTLSFTRVAIQTPTWILPFAMNQMITILLYKEFRATNKDFKQFIDPNGRFHGSVRYFRQRHQAACRAVREADRIIFYADAAAHTSHAIIITFLIYEVTSQAFTSDSDIYIIIAYLVVNFLLLTITTIDGIVVNQAAHELIDSVYDIDVSSLDSKEVDELVVFQKRLAGNPIGFSSIGLFVNQKSSILNILALLLAYAFLVVQLTSAPKTYVYDSVENTTVMNIEVSESS